MCFEGWVQSKKEDDSSFESYYPAIVFMIFGIPFKSFHYGYKRLFLRNELFWFFDNIVTYHVQIPSKYDLLNNDLVIIMKLQ